MTKGRRGPATISGVPGRTLILTFSLREKELSLPLGETDAKRQ